MKKLFLVGYYSVRLLKNWRSLLIASVALILLSRGAVALDISTAGGVIYRGCEITKVEAGGLRLTHRDGVAFVSFDDLPK